MNEILILDICVTICGRMFVMHPVLLTDSNELILVDCGYPTLLPQIKADALKKGVDLNKLTKIIVTHQDFDHSGGLYEFKKAYPHIEILSSENQEPYISGKEDSPRLQHIKDADITEAQMDRIRTSLIMFGEPRFVDVDIKLKDHQILPWCGGIEVIPTPGHLFGHISLYLKELRTFISGDALILRKTGLCLPNNDLYENRHDTIVSLKNLLNYDIEKIVCYHGGVFEGDSHAAIRRILESLNS